MNKPTKKRIKSSPVWEDFEVCSNSNGKLVRCNKCSKTMSYSSSTSGMMKHITSYHYKPERKSDVKQKEKHSEPESSDSVPSVRVQKTMARYVHSKPELSKSEKKSMDRSLALFVIENYLPLRIVESNSFHNLIKNAIHSINLHVENLCIPM